MITRKVTLKGELPYSAQHAQRFGLLANSFASSVMLQDARGTFNGKSLLGVLSLGKLSGRELNLLVEGRDEERAAEALVELLESEHSPL